MFPLKAAQQEGPADEVRTVVGVGTVGGQAHELSLAVADEHDPLGQVAPRLDGTAHDLLERFQIVRHGGRAGFFPRLHDQDVDFLFHTEIPPFRVLIMTKGWLCALKALSHVMADLSCVILADGDGGVVERRQSVGPDVDYLGGAAPQALHDVADMLTVQPQKSLPDQLGGDVLAIHPDMLPAAGTGFRHQLHIAVDLLDVIRALPVQKVVVDIFSDLLPVPIYLIHPHPVMCASGR